MPKRDGKTTAKSATDKVAELEPKTEKKIIRKNAFEDSFYNYIDGIDPTLRDKIFQVKFTKISEPNTPKMDAAFVLFSENGMDDDEVNNEVNIECIKTILFHYHIAPDKVQNKVKALQIIDRKDETEPYCLCYQEIYTNQ